MTHYDSSGSKLVLSPSLAVSSALSDCLDSTVWFHFDHVTAEGPWPALAVELIAAASTTCSAVSVRKTVPTDRKLAQKDWDEPEVLPGSTSD